MGGRPGGGGVQETHTLVPGPSLAGMFGSLVKQREVGRVGWVKVRPGTAKLLMHKKYISIEILLRNN